MKNIAVIGDGGWGTALALVLYQNGHRVRVWGPFPEYLAETSGKRENVKFLPGIALPDGIEWTADRRTALEDADVLLLVTPSKFYREVAFSMAPHLPSDCRIVSATKGLDKETHHRMSETALEALGRGPVAVLSGPSHAEEVAKGAPTAVVVACEDDSTAEDLQRIFSNNTFRVYTSRDVVGVELGGTLKNVVAIAAGVSDGLGYGDNTKAALVTRGLAEITRLGAALGAHPATFSGLSGMGDLIVTCTSRLSRNRGVGERIGKGESPKDIMASMDQVTEGVWNCANARALAAEVNVEAPITNEVYAVVHEGKDPREAVLSLLSRDTRAEQD